MIWINNSEPDSVLSFLRKKGDDEILVMLNLSNRRVHVSVDLPVMDYYKIDNLLKDGQTWFELYSGRVTAKLAAFEEVVGRMEDADSAAPAWWCTGAAIAPSRQHARYSTPTSSRFGLCHATTSPAPVSHD